MPSSSLSACNTASSDGVVRSPYQALPAPSWTRRKVARRIALGCQRRGHGKADVEPVRDFEEKPDLSHGEMMGQASLSILDSATTDEEATPAFGAPSLSSVSQPGRTEPFFQYLSLPVHR